MIRREMKNHASVLPDAWFFISLLIIAEAVTGTLVLLGGAWTQAGLIALIGFHVGQLAFGGVMWVWAPLMLVTLALLLRAERQAAPHDEGHGLGRGRVRLSGVR